MTDEDALRHWNRSPWQWCFPLRWLYRFMQCRLGWRTKWHDEETYLRAVMRSTFLSYRLLDRSMSVDELDRELPNHREWRALRPKIQDGDKIWPYIINPFLWGMQAGYVVVRRGKPIGVVVRIVS